MAPAWPCRRFRYFKHFIQPLGGIVTCTPVQLPIVKEGSEAFNGYSFGERKINEFGATSVSTEPSRQPSHRVVSNPFSCQIQNRDAEMKKAKRLLLLREFYS